MILKIINIVVMLLVFVVSDGYEAVLKENKKIFCLYDTNSFKRPGESKFYVQNITTQYCTHVIYEYVEINVDGEVKSKDRLFDFEENVGKGNIRKFNEIKQNNKNIKTLVMFGGWHPVEHLGYYSDVFRLKKNQEKFIKSSIDFIVKYNFDGMVLFWVWPGILGGDFFADRKNLILILKKLKIEMKKRNLQLNIFCHGNADLMKETYNVKKIAEYVDYIFVLSYDYYDSSSNHIGIYSGLYLHPGETNSVLSADSGISSWINLGAPSEKIIMGVSLTSRSYTLKYENQTIPGSPFSSVGSTSDYLSERGQIIYIELCQKLSNESWRIVWEDTQKNPYAFKSNQWVGYENERSLEIKAKYVIEKNLGGVFIAHTGDDDFVGVCGEKYPLHRVLNKYLCPFKKSDCEYILNVNVFKKSLTDQSVYCVYHTSKVITFKISL